MEEIELFYSEQCFDNYGMLTISWLYFPDVRGFSPIIEIWRHVKPTIGDIYHINLEIITVESNIRDVIVLVFYADTSTIRPENLNQFYIDFRQKFPEIADIFEEILEIYIESPKGYSTLQDMAYLYDSGYEITDEQLRKHIQDFLIHQKLLEQKKSSKKSKNPAK